MPNTTKKRSTSDFQQGVEYAFNENTRTIGTSSFVISKVNHELNFIDVSATIQQIQYIDEAVVLFTLQITYADASRASVTNVKRIT